MTIYKREEALALKQKQNVKIKMHMTKILKWQHPGFSPSLLSNFCTARHYSQQCCKQTPRPHGWEANTLFIQGRQKRGGIQKRTSTLFAWGSAGLFQLNFRIRESQMAAPFTLIRKLRFIHFHSNTSLRGGDQILLAEAEPNPNN